MTNSEIKAFAKQVGDHCFDHILPFWSGPALDNEHGGWLPWLSNDLKADHAKPQGLVLNNRILWTFAAAHDVRQEARFHDLADRALDWVMNRFWDKQHGGGFWRLEDNGKVLDDSKQVYGEAFCIYGLAQYHLAFNSPPALARAKEVFALLDKHAREPKHGGYWESRSRDWLSPVRSQVGGAELGATKSMNTNLHVMEAFTTLYRAWKDPLLADRLRELLCCFRDKILDPRTQHFHHFFDDSWKVLSDNYTFGHDIEGSWLLCEAAEVLGDKKLLHEMEQIAVRMAEATLKEGLSAEGGLCYEGKDGKVVDAGKEWWPQAEAVVGFINAYQISREQKYLDAAKRVWDYIEQRIVDHAHGDWFWRINPDGKVDGTKPKVSEWKCPYHSGRACLEAARRLNAPERSA